jgi:hypothetical protein
LTDPSSLKAHDVFRASQAVEDALADRIPFARGTIGGSQGV